MIDMVRYLDATHNVNNEIDVRVILIDRFKGLLEKQPEKLERLIKALNDPELLSVKGKSVNMQIFMVNHVLSRLLYKYSGRTGISISTVRVALVDTHDLKTWLNLIDMGVLPMFVTHDVV